MKRDTKNMLSTASGALNVARTAMCVSVLALALTGCKHFGAEEHAQVAGWTLVDPTERHPILVSQEPQTMNVRVSRGAGGLSPQQRGELVSFAGRSRASDAGNSKLVISAPSGSSNEVAAMRAVHEMRQLLSDSGIAETSMAVEVYSGEGDANAPIRVTYYRYVAQGPNCPNWSENLAHDPQNLPHTNMGCATQKNLAAMIANPADLLGPRGETARSGERRDVVWEKFQRGETTGAKKSSDEKIKTDGDS
jgi:pilus assembly protein CpaD